MRRLLLTIFRLGTRKGHCWLCGVPWAVWHDADRLCGKLQARPRREAERLLRRIYGVTYHDDDGVV